LDLGRLHGTFRFISVARSRTVSRTPWTGDQLVARTLLTALDDCDDDDDDDGEVDGMNGFGRGNRSSLTTLTNDRSIYERAVLNTEVAFNSCYDSVKVTDLNYKILLWPL
jgi:hypothetical protein